MERGRIRTDVSEFNSSVHWAAMLHPPLGVVGGIFTHVAVGLTALAHRLYDVGASTLPSLRVLLRPLGRQWNWRWKRGPDLH